MSEIGGSFEPAAPMLGCWIMVDPKAFGSTSLPRSILGKRPEPAMLLMAAFLFGRSAAIEVESLLFMLAVASP